MQTLRSTQMLQRRAQQSVPNQLPGLSEAEEPPIGPGWVSLAAETASPPLPASLTPVLKHPRRTSPAREPSSQGQLLGTEVAFFSLLQVISKLEQKLSPVFPYLLSPMSLLPTRAQ